ncbi:MAG TPA: PqqD family protein [Rhodothermales bacterium]
MSIRYTPKPDVVTTEIENTELVLLDLRTRRYYTLNETGMFIWQRLAKGSQPDEIAAAFSAEWSLSPEEGRSEVLKLLGELESEGLVIRADSAAE